MNDMDLKNFKSAMDNIFGSEDSIEKQILLTALKDDLDPPIESVTDEILGMFNVIFNKRSRLITKKVLNRYKEILKHYTIEELRVSMLNAKNDEFHVDTSYKYCTLEYFSRLDQIDKWINVSKKNGFILPKMNL